MTLQRNKVTIASGTGPKSNGPFGSEATILG